MTFLAYKFQLRFNLKFLICSSALFQFAFCWNFCLSGRWPLFRDFSFFYYFPTSSLNLIFFRQRSEPSWKKLVYGAPAKARKQNASDLWKPKSWKRYAYPMFAVRNLCVTKYARANTFTFCEPLFSTFCCNKTLFFPGACNEQFA